MLPYQGTDRHYLIALPPGYDGSSAFPLILSFHGFGGSKEVHEANTSLGREGAARGFVVVTPDALGEPRAWNFLGSTGEADDYGFVLALVADLEARLCIDPGRVYAAGHSNGSAFAAFVVCKPPFPFAAVALVSATTPSTCTGDVAPSVLAIAGTADPQVPYAGGTVAGSTINIPAAPDVIDLYAQRYRCGQPAEQRSPSAGVEQRRFHGCTGGAEVVLDTVIGGVHAWPGSPSAAASPGNSDAAKTFDADAEILDFFGDHHRQAGAA